MFANPLIPNLADFTQFAYDQGVPQADLATTSPYLAWAYNYGLNVTITAPGDMPPIIYIMAVYNLAFHQLLKVAQDVTGQTFFATQRKAFNLLSFVTGPVSSSGDEGTNQSLVVPKWMETMTISANDCIRTPWGLSYLDYSMCYGSTVWGCS